MGNKKSFFHCAGIALTSLLTAIMTLAISSAVYAQESPPATDNGTCASCHENLYFLHDTGNWFCIREAPMRCVDCHGGNPNALTQDDAHSNRKVHPIVNEDISKCQECHPEECVERVETFDEIAGIPDVMIAAPFQPKPNLFIEEVQAAPAVEPIAQHAWTSFFEIIALVLIAGLALAVYFLHKAQQAQK